MAKGYVIVDMPKNCVECRITEQTSDFVCCCYLDDVWLKSTVKKSRRKNCPIKELPKRLDENKARTLTVENWFKGWNACLDKIEGENENENE